MTHQGSTKYVYKLKEFENMYNKSFHKSIQGRPCDVQPSNQNKTYKILYEKNYPKIDERKEIFKINDPVLISKVKKIFEKGSDPTFGTEIFYVDQIRPSYPRTYILRDKNGELIVGGFYREEMLKVSHP